MNRVTIIQRILYNYRVDFYKMLKERLLRNDIELQLIVEENRSQDTINFLDFFDIKKNWHLPFFGEEIIYQPYLHLLNNSDLVFLELGNRILSNYLYMLRRLYSPSIKIAFWGHALNMQVDQNSWRNKFKKTYFKNVDWWFPYTEGMANILKNAGFPPERITTIYNTTDTEKMIELNDKISGESTESLRKKLGISRFPVGIFCGRIYKEKRTNFLLEACFEIKKLYPDFTMIVIGDEQENNRPEKRLQQYPWIKYIGAAYDEEKVKYFKLADVFLSPGLVGLSVTESFALGVPMITTDYPYHSPEVEYIKNGENGIIVENSVDSYVREVSRVFENNGYLERLKEGCRQASKIYTLDNMVNRLVSGIKECLKI